MVDDAGAHGARIVLGSKPHALGGLFYEPIILAGTGDDTRMARREMFGPVFAINLATDEIQCTGPDAILKSSDEISGRRPGAISVIAV